MPVPVTEEVLTDTDESTEVAALTPTTTGVTLKEDDDIEWEKPTTCNRENPEECESCQ